MNFNNQVALILSALMLSFGGLSISAEGKARQCASAECACETALARNTIAALEDYLKQYQHDASGKTTACAALSLPAEGESLADQKTEYDPSTAQSDMSAE